MNSLCFSFMVAADGATNLQGDAEWDRNLYRHPSRQGEHPTEKYRMHHDIYSLGVCLLEIGLGECFVEYGANDEVQPCALLTQDFRAWQISHGQNSWSVSLQLKDYFIYLTKARLPQLTGDRYVGVVLSCLTCLDEDHLIEDGSQEEDADGIHVGMQFIQDVLLQLDELMV